MKIGTLLKRFFHSQISRLVTIVLITSAWSIPAFCGEIHYAAEHGDIAKVGALLKDRGFSSLPKAQARRTCMINYLFVHESSQ
jgi:hypothetical protein